MSRAPRSVRNVSQVHRARHLHGPDMWRATCLRNVRLPSVVRSAGTARGGVQGSSELSLDAAAHPLLASSRRPRRCSRRIVKPAWYSGPVPIPPRIHRQGTCGASRVAMAATRKLWASGAARSTGPAGRAGSNPVRASCAFLNVMFCKRSTRAASLCQSSHRARPRRAPGRLATAASSGPETTVCGRLCLHLRRGGGRLRCLGGVRRAGVCAL